MKVHISFSFLKTVLSLTYDYAFLLLSNAVHSYGTSQDTALQDELPNHDQNWTCNSVIAI